MYFQCNVQMTFAEHELPWNFDWGERYPRYTFSNTFKPSKEEGNWYMFGYWPPPVQEDVDHLYQSLFSKCMATFHNYVFDS